MSRLGDAEVDKDDAARVETLDMRCRGGRLWGVTVVEQRLSGLCFLIYKCMRAACCGCGQVCLL
jgi:hypothetical protein